MNFLILFLVTSCDSLSLFYTVRMSSESSQHHINSVAAMIERSEVVGQLMQPMYKHFGINSCGYFLAFESGETLFLSSKYKIDDKPIQKYLEGKKRLSPIKFMSHQPTTGYYLADVEPSIVKNRSFISDELIKERDYFHEFVSVDIVKTARGKAIRMIAYSAPTARTDINRFYLNNLDLMQQLNNYLSEHLEESVNRLPLITPNCDELKLSQELFSRMKPNKNIQIRNFCRETDLHYPKLTELAGINLTEREKDVIHWYLLGKTISETAEILNIKPTTDRKTGSYL